MDGNIIADRYELCGRLANGGMSTVFRGWDHRLRRPVAVKVVPAPARSKHFSKDTGEQWKWEAWVMAAMQHPHVVTVYDVIRDHERGYVVMELVEGQTLTRLLAQSGPLPWAETLYIGAQVCQALYALHTQGFIHCDVKPQNIIRTSSGWVKLADFGIAQRIGSWRRLAYSSAGLPDAMNRPSPGTLMGTATYCSPEQALGEPLTEATDLYSLGVVLYELLIGVPPFIGETPQEVITQHAFASVPALCSLCSDVPAAVEQVVLQALSKHPARRFGSALAMGAALEHVYAATIAAQPVAVPSGVAQRILDASIAPSHSLSVVVSAAAKLPLDYSALHANQLDLSDSALHGQREDATTEALLPVLHNSSHRIQGGITLVICIADVVGLVLIIILLAWASGH